MGSVNFAGTGISASDTSTRGVQHPVVGSVVPDSAIETGQLRHLQLPTLLRLEARIAYLLPKGVSMIVQC